MTNKNNSLQLDEDEKEILEAYENGKLVPSPSQTDFREVARNTMKKSRKINIRISENDLSSIQTASCSRRYSVSDFDRKRFAQICEWVL